MTLTEERWLPTPAAAKELGLTSSTLRRYVRNHIFVEGVDFRPGVYSTSPYVFDVIACREKLEYKGALRKRAAVVITEAQKEPAAV